MPGIDRTRLGTPLSAGLLGWLLLAACSDTANDGNMLAGVSGAGAAVPATAGSAGASPAGAGGAGGIGSGAAGSSPAGSGPAGSGGEAAGSGGTDEAGSGGNAGAAGEAGAAGSSAPGVDRPPAISLSLPTTMENPNVAPWFNIYRPTDLSATGQPLPVIVWANGGCFRSDFTWAPLFERWAAGGFVVLALTESPDAGAFGMSSVDDHGALVDWAIEQAEQDGSPYAGMLDTERIVASGNSCGGVTALGVAASDERVAAVFVLSGSSALASTDTSVMSAIAAPIGYVVGNRDEDIASPNAFADYEAMSDGVPAMIVSRSSGDHITVSTDTNVLADVAEIALNWMDLALYGTQDAADALNSPNVCASCEPGVWTMTSKHLETLQ